MNTATVTAVIIAVVAVLGLLGALARAIYRQASSTDKNSDAITELNKSIQTLSGKLDNLDTRVDDHEVRVAVLEDRRQRSR